MGNVLNPYLLSPLVVGTLSAICIADERPAVDVSPTFQDVVRRIVDRDPDSGAILRVRAKDDAPAYGRMELNFAIRQTGADAAVVVLSAPTMTADVYEQYVLKLDAPLRAELAKHKVFAQQQEEKRRVWEAKQRAKIPAVTGGRLHYGMSPDDVKKVLGTPASENIWQKAGGLNLNYADLTLTFDGGLVDVEVPEKPATREAKP